MTFTEYLNTETDNAEDIFEFYLTYLTNFSVNDFPYEENLKLKGVTLKFINCIEKIYYFEKTRKEDFTKLVEKLNFELRFYRNTKRNPSALLDFIIKNRKNRILNLQDVFEEIYSTSLTLITESTKHREYKNNNLKLDGFYNPENSNKIQIKNLVKEAIELINSDNSITEKTKKQLIDYLNNVLKKLDREHINWSSVIGHIKEVIIVLGALGSCVGGITPLFQAKEKLEETSTVIQKTSVNLNYNSINETFNIQNIEQIGQLNSTILMLNEKNEALENK